MQMRRHDHITRQKQFLLNQGILQAFNDEHKIRFSLKYRQPRRHGAGRIVESGLRRKQTEPFQSFPTFMRGHNPGAIKMLTRRHHLDVSQTFRTPLLPEYQSVAHVPVPKSQAARALATALHCQQYETPGYDRTARSMAHL